jgi:hypothetical protein
MWNSSCFDSRKSIRNKLHPPSFQIDPFNKASTHNFGYNSEEIKRMSLNILFTLADNKKISLNWNWTGYWKKDRLMMNVIWWIKKGMPSGVPANACWPLET